MSDEFSPPHDSLVEYQEASAAWQAEATDLTDSIAETTGADPDDLYYSLREFGLAAEIDVDDAHVAEWARVQAEQPWLSEELEASVLEADAAEIDVDEP